MDNWEYKLTALVKFAKFESVTSKASKDIALQTREILETIVWWWRKPALTKQTSVQIGDLTELVFNKSFWNLATLLILRSALQWSWRILGKWSNAKSLKKQQKELLF